MSKILGEKAYKAIRIKVREKLKIITKIMIESAKERSKKINGK